MPDQAARLDVTLHEKYSDYSRSYIQSLITDGSVKINKQVVTKTGTKIKKNDNISVQFPKKFKIKQLDLPVIYEDSDCVVIDKPIGVLVHSKGAFNPEATVADWLRPRTKGFDGSSRDGIVHRLDRATSGIMICAKTPEALSWLQKQFSSRKVKKEYLALIEGSLEQESAIIDLPIGRNPKSPQRFRVDPNGKKAMTEYSIKKEITKKHKVYSLIELRPTTGRTHQLRVHLNYLKRPIIGDSFYDGMEADRLYLHAHKLEITLLSRKREIFISSMPDNFNKPKVK